MAERTSSSRRPKPASDDAIGNFVIDKEIGKGSFAQVYSGRHKVSITSPGSRLGTVGNSLRHTFTASFNGAAGLRGYLTPSFPTTPAAFRANMGVVTRSPAPWSLSSPSSFLASIRN